MGKTRGVGEVGNGERKLAFGTKVVNCHRGGRTADPDSGGGGWGMF